MSDWYLLVAVFWAVFALDGLRRCKRVRFALTGIFPRFVFGRQQPIHVLPPFPWAWRWWADDPPFSVSPVGISNRPAGGAARPADQPLCSAGWRWEEVKETVAQGGWIWINGERFCPEVPAWPVEELRRLVAALPARNPSARAVYLERWLQTWFRPTHWQRRMTLIRHVSRWAGLANTIAFFTAGGLTVAVLAIPLGFGEETTDALYARLPAMLLTTLGAYFCGLVAAVVAARRLKRWLLPGTMKTIFSSAVFPPQGLRWRRVLTEACPPAPHVLLLASAKGSGALRRELAFNALADVRWPAAAPDATTPLISEIRIWHGAVFEKLLRRWCTQSRIDAAALLAAPAPDGPASRSYCPRCHAQFVRPDGFCPHGVALVPFERSDSGTKSK